MKQLVEVISGPLGDALSEFGDPNPDATLATLGKPRHAHQGDLAVPLFALAKHLGKSPLEVSESLANRLAPVLTNIDGCGEVTFEGGFCNFFTDTKWLAEQAIREILTDPSTAGHFSQPTSLLIEHTSANPNGPFHVGRARNAILGDTFTRMHRLAGDEVRAEYYVDDMGKQVGILAWALDNLSEQKVSEILATADMDEESNHPDKPDHQRVRWYQAANVIKEDDPDIEAGVTELVQASEEADVATLAKFESAYQPVLDGMLATLARLGISFDSFTKESKFIVDGSVNQVMEQLTASELHGVEENGAHYLELENRGVKGKNTKFFFQRGDGSSLYATRDIAYHRWKWTQAENLVNILGEDHRLQSLQVSVALDELGVQRPDVVFYAFTKLPEGKMSTRRGNVVFMDDLLDEAKLQAIEVVKGVRRYLNDDELEAIGEAVGMSAVRFNIARISPEKGINFKWAEALSFEADSAPFIMYSHTRACSIRRKIEAADHNIEDLLDDDIDFSNLNESAGSLVKLLATFGEALNESLSSQRPNLFCSYLLALATEFNRFYRDNPVFLDGEVNTTNLALCESARLLMAAGCEGVGIIPVQEM